MRKKEKNYTISNTLTHSNHESERKKAILKHLRYWIISFDGAHTLYEYNKQNLKPSSSNILKYFGNWDNALNQTGIIYTKSQYTDDQLLLILKEWAAKYPGPFTIKVYNELENVPEAKLYKFHFGSWSKAIKKAGLEQIRETIRTNEISIKKETILNNLRVWIQSFDGPHSSHQYQQQKMKPCYDSILHYFGTWENAIAQTGVSYKKKKYTERQLVDILKRWGQEYNGPYTRKAYNNAELTPNAQAIIYQLGNWSNALKKAGLPIGVGKKHYSDEELIVHLKQWKEHSGGPYSVSEYKKTGFKPCADKIIQHFGKWSIALKRADICDIPERTMGKFTNEETLEVLKKWHKQTEGPFSGPAYIKSRLKPSYSMIVLKFGSWKKAKELAGIS